MDQGPQGVVRPVEVVTPAVVPERPFAAPRKARGLGCLVLFLGVALGFSLLLNLMLAASNESFSDPSVKQKYHSLSRSAKDKVAVVEIEGTIMDGENERRILEVIERDKNVKAIVLRVVSPGGTVSGSDLIYHHLVELVERRKIPLVVSMGGIAASGGYYVSMAVGHAPNTIFAEPTTWTGSIGVIIPHYNFSGFLAEHKIEEDSIKSAPLKAIGSFTKPMTEEERKILQGLVDDSFSDFKKIVQSGRERFTEHPEELDQVATGQVFTATQAKEKGLVDEIGYIEDAIDRAIELAALDKDKTKAVKFYRQTGLFEVLSGSDGAAARQGGFDLAGLLDLTVPRAYYMCTWLPSLGSVQRP